MPSSGFCVHAALSSHHCTLDARFPWVTVNINNLNLMQVTVLTNCASMRLKNHTCVCSEPKPITLWGYKMHWAKQQHGAQKQKMCDTSLRPTTQPLPTLLLEHVVDALWCAWQSNSMSQLNGLPFSNLWALPAHHGCDSHSHGWDHPSVLLVSAPTSTSTLDVQISSCGQKMVGTRAMNSWRMTTLQKNLLTKVPWNQQLVTLPTASCSMKQVMR